MQVNTVKVPESDIMATNGVIHFVNQVLYPGGTISTPSSVNLLWFDSVICICYECLTAVNALHCLPDIPVGSQELLMLLKRLITYMQIKVLKKLTYCN